MESCRCRAHRCICFFSGNFSHTKRTGFLKEVIMTIPAERKEYIIKSIEDLPPQRIQELIDFIDFLRIKFQQEKAGVNHSSLLLQQNTLARIWHDDEDLYAL
jgi:hypothetical protein